MAFDAGTVILQSHVRVPFRGEIRETTLGRVLFNEIFPEDFPFQDEAMTKKTLAESHGQGLRDVRPGKYC